MLKLILIIVHKNRLLTLIITGCIISLSHPAMSASRAQENNNNNNNNKLYYYYYYYYNTCLNTRSKCDQGSMETLLLVVSFGLSFHNRSIKGAIMCIHFSVIKECSIY